MEHCLGPDVALRGVGLVCTESIVALMYDEVNLNLFKMNTEDFHEYLDSAISEENSSNLKFAVGISFFLSVFRLRSIHSGRFRQAASMKS